ncbi:hypothetical protein LZF95_20880 [Algoriphagus sp. AGSA1]|uniref:hypothetical protein n=1 Tax=Algoriphagus sp. AGSA1 TaxID=2907213 RepID=UPI001F229748|nr:hypothetical protein [Algoriphagus sp. AGSA1]MCE7057148.1 hypothetical protein [Algoriphagus sp. AGSA1]
MVDKLFSKKGIIIIVIPLFAIFLQLFLRYILGKDFNTIGITLGALGLGQILPFFYFDHFVANKILGITPNYEYSNGKLCVTYDVTTNIPKEDIDKLKNLFIIAIFLNLGLFLITVYFGLTDKILLHTIFGTISCFVSWFLLIFK